MTRISRSLAALALVLAAASAAAAQTVTYRVSVPEPEHHWLHVEATFPALPRAPLMLTMSRSSPGRYATHEFSKNIFEIRIDDGAGKALAYERPAVNQWRVAQHAGTVRVTYKIYGDRIDGTYLGIDHTHAHMNMPATLMWAEGLESRPARITFVPPQGRTWRIASQLFPASDPLTFTAPNLQYLMDSPTEFSDHVLKSFSVKGPDGRDVTLRVAVHHLGTDAEVQKYADDIAKIARVQAMIFGELRSSPIICPGPTATAWSIATAPSSPAARSRRDSARRRTSCFMPGTSSASGLTIWSRSISGTPTSPTRSGSRRGSRSTTDRSRSRARASPT
jgi:hypothetical protein